MVAGDVTLDAVIVKDFSVPPLTKKTSKKDKTCPWVATDVHCELIPSKGGIIDMLLPNEYCLRSVVSYQTIAAAAVIGTGVTHKGQQNMR
jgi:hypothetical protein